MAHHIKDDDQRALRRLIEDRLFDPNAQFTVDRRLTTPLRYAAELGRLGMLRVLTNAGASVHRDAEAAITAALRGQHVECIEWLMPYADVANMHRAGITRTLVVYGDVACVRAMHRGGLRYGHRELILAVNKEKADIIAAILDCGVNPNCIIHNVGHSLIHHAVIRSSFACVQALVYYKVVPDQISNKGGENEIHAAIRRGRTDMLQLLLIAGRDPNMHQPPATAPIVLAAKLGDVAAIQLLRKHGAGGAGGDALYAAAHAGKPAAMAALLDTYEVNIETPYHAAARAGSVECVRMASLTAAPIDAQNARGDTALHIAVVNDAGEVVTELLQRGASLAIANNAGHCPAALARDPQGNVASRLLLSVLQKKYTELLRAPADQPRAALFQAAPANQPRAAPFQAAPADQPANPFLAAQIQLQAAINASATQRGVKRYAE